jgi:hypothetical protein
MGKAKACFSRKTPIAIFDNITLCAIAAGPCFWQKAPGRI